MTNAKCRMETPPVTDPGSRVLDVDAFTRAFRNFPAGVAVITADPGDGPVGLTASSVISVSAAPPMLAFSVSDRSSSAGALLRATTLVVHLLEADQVGLAKRCAARSEDRFSDPSIWERLDTGEPHFPEAANWIRGEIVDRFRAGTATLFVVKALSAKSGCEGGPDSPTNALIYHNRSWHRLSDATVV